MELAPLFVVGEGRSGTTIFYRLMTQHPAVAWINAWTARFPRLAFLSFLSRLNNFDNLERRFRDWRWWPRPADEAFGVLDYCFREPKFTHAIHEWTEDDVTIYGAETLRALLSAYCLWHGKPRFLAKYTGFLSIDFMRRIFPLARFAHIQRDPRAVVFSHLKLGWRYGFPQHEFLRLSREERIQYLCEKYLIYYQARRKYSIPDDFFQIRYEELVQDPMGSIAQVCTYWELDFSVKFQQRLSTWTIRSNANDQYLHVLSDREISLLTGLLEEPLIETGYI